MGNDLRMNLIGSVLLTMLSIAILVGSAIIGTDSNKPLYASPALMPGMLGVALLGCSLLLFWQSVRTDGVRVRLREAGSWLRSLARHPDTRTTLVGLALMVLYTFLLVRLLPFWAASLIFAFAMLVFLRAVRWYWALIISGATVGAIVLLFTTIFNIPLP